MDIRNVDHALHQIEQMVIIARRSTEGLKPSKDPAYRLVLSSEAELLEFTPATSWIR